METSSDIEQLVVLVVEDEPMLRLFIVDEMMDYGWQVYEAADGIEALVVLELHSDVELVFTDIRMPGMDGIELLRVVHARWPKILLMASSGHCQIKTSELPDDARFVPKPIDHNLLIAEVKDLLATHGRAASQRHHSQRLPP